MRYLVDTGILARLLHRNDPLHARVRHTLRRLRQEGHTFVTSSQNMAEFWNLCTRPAGLRGGFGLSVEEAARRLRLLERFVTVLKEPGSAYETWKRLLVVNSVAGKEVHDARLAALMKAYRIRRILTLNGADFKRYKGIEVIDPDSI